LQGLAKVGSSLRHLAGGEFAARKGEWGVVGVCLPGGSLLRKEDKQRSNDGTDGGAGRQMI
jgi:hypothetical protein